MTPETKAALRRAVLRRRDALPESERVLLSRLIVASVLDLPAYENADVVLAYASFGTELQTDGLLRRVLTDGKTLLLPRVERGGLELYEVRGLVKDLEPGTWGIREPIPDRCPLASPDEVDFALVPGVAFDKRARRLGYGGGFYDRLLAGGLPGGAALVSGAFGVQIVDEVPTGPHDVPVGLVVTEGGTYVRDGV